MLNGPALSNTARSQNHVGWIMEGPNAVYACTIIIHQLHNTLTSSVQKKLLPVCRVVVEIVHNTRLCIEVLSQLVTVQNNYQSTIRAIVMTTLLVYEIHDMMSIVHVFAKLLSSTITYV